ncbi:MAG: hypothetical protein WDN28_04920 [Chthoniobacter sp.]
MNLRPILASVLLLTGLTGCATFTPAELGQIRQRGVSPVVVGKIEQGRVLTPPDVIELTRRGVPDSFILRQIEDAGVDYILNRDDVKKLQAAHVSRPVMDALFAASDDFASRYGPPGRARVYGSFAPYPYGGGPYYGPIPVLRPVPVRRGVPSKLVAAVITAGTTATGARNRHERVWRVPFPPVILSLRRTSDPALLASDAWPILQTRHHLPPGW